MGGEWLPRAPGTLGTSPQVIVTVHSRPPLGLPVLGPHLGLTWSPRRPGTLGPRSSATIYWTGSGHPTASLLPAVASG